MCSNQDTRSSHLCNSLLEGQFAKVENDFNLEASCSSRRYKSSLIFKVTPVRSLARNDGYLCWWIVVVGSDALAREACKVVGGLAK